MKISENHKNIIVKEFLGAAKLMKEDGTAEDKMFYFSSTFGILSRIFNLEYDPQLVLAHFILQSAHGNISARIKAINDGDQVIKFPGEFIDKLSNKVEVLADLIEKNEDLYGTLQDINEITFVTTGNGYFLYKKGILKI